MAPVRNKMFSLTAMALLASPALSQIFTDYIEFNPPALSISDLQGSASFAARLKTPPSDTATIFWDMPGLSSSSCNTVFTKDNYNVFQTIIVSPLPQYTANNTITFSITAKASAANTTYDSNEEIYPVTRAMTPAQTCTSVGDPHFKTFGGFTFDYHTVGVHYLVKHKQLTIQTMQFLCNAATGAFCNSGVAIRYGKSIVVIATDANNKASTAMTVRQASATIDGLVVTGSMVNSHFLISIGSDGSQIELQANLFNGFNYVDITTRLASTYAGQVGGLCGTYKAGPDTGTGLTCADGSITASAAVFGDSWIVPAPDNIFVLGDKCTTQIIDVPPTIQGAICAIPNPFPNANAPPPPAPDAPASTTLVQSVITNVIEKTVTNVQQVTVGGPPAAPAPDATSTAVVVVAPAPVTSTVTTTAQVVTTTTGADGQVSTATVTTTAVEVVTATATATPAAPAAPAGGAAATVTATQAVTVSSVVQETVYLTTQVAVTVPAAAATATVVSTVVSTQTYFTTITNLPVYTPTPAAPAPPAPSSTNGATQIYNQVTPPGQDPPAPERPSTCSIDFYNEVNKNCISIFVAPGCGEIVQLSFFINACIKDALLSGSYVFAEAAKQNMMSNCRAKSQAAISITSDPVLVQQGQTIAAAAGVGSSPCPGGCGNGGMCTPNGCMCKIGFAGQSCEVDVSKLAINTASGPLMTQNGATVQQTIAVAPADPNNTGAAANPAAPATGDPNNGAAAPAAGGAYPATAGSTTPAAGTTAGGNTAAAPATGATTNNTGGKTGTGDVVVSSASSIFKTGASVVSVLLAAAALF
ncbi:hypothetical protein HDU87_007373 [Geranomyces variabilis]|uniref:VWFD domain-containing protein n=1 Tax=Geranomyces variabilis TaxID=109894 RepID=A0AAD5TPC3_9FUNG|nr:hypothetical protein HDU87_007373 [Geranomyces variabilis]